MSQTDPMIQYWALRLWDKFRVEEMYEELEAFREEVHPAVAGSKPDNEGETQVEPEASGAEGPLDSLVP